MDLKGYDGVGASTQDRQGLAVFWRRSVFDLISHKDALCSKMADPIIQVDQSVFNFVYINIKKVKTERPEDTPPRSSSVTKLTLIAHKEYTSI